MKRDTAEGDRDVAVTFAGLGALAWVGAERLDADVDGAQRRRVPPLPGSPRIDLSKALSWKQRTVVIGPANVALAP
jgi:hypothetical protein